MKSLPFYIPGKISLLMIIPGIILLSCCTTNSGGKSSKKNTSPSHSRNEIFSINTKDQQQTVYFGDIVEFNLETKKNIPVDSLSLSFNGDAIQIQKINNRKFQFTAPDISAGQKSYRVSVFFADSMIEYHTLKVMILPKESPKVIDYKVIRSFPHDPEAYTQGLLYYNNYIYESTGQNNRSSLRKINPENGDVLRKKGLDSQYFGEGLGLYKDELYMLTYKARKVFVYDLETFNEKRSYDLQTNEGWGLTYDGKEMIVSDGSAYLYFFDPEYFTLNNQIEVCNNQGLVHSLNELEITPHGLFANIYTKNDIVLIDINKGVVKGILDLSDLVPESLPHNADYVLNGIAYNKKSNTFYVTGKQWPVMFEIKLLTDL